MGNTSRDRSAKYRNTPKTHIVKGHGFPVVINFGTCTPCGKKTYGTRKLAKTAQKFANMNNDHEVEPYRCHYNPTLWHLGGRKRKGTDGTGVPA